jgi:hypothetical protein
MKPSNFFIFLYLFILFFSNFAFFGLAQAYEKYSPGNTAVIGEFVYEDDFTPATSPGCTITIYNPSGDLIVNNAAMTSLASGWTYYNYSIPGIGPNGAWPTQMTCGTVLGGDLVKADKTFVVGTTESDLATKIESAYKVTLSDFGETTVNTAYKAKLQILNYATVPTDADSLPTVTVTDPVGTNQVSGATMTKDSNGKYSYSYSIGSGAIGGVWETVVSVVVNGETIRVNDYWNVSSSPADVNITEITDKIIPHITASVRIDNMGTAGSDFYYVYCIVNSEENLCGGNDDIDYASDTAYINPGNHVNLSLP